tara:strand:- start:249 stop:1070 length:822 start_codon:yes stop_codon:yes gene_type:complete
MKTIIASILILISINAIAQKKEKLAGNKDVVEVYKTLNSFSQLEIFDKLEVFILQADTTECRLVADSNLIDAIKFDVLNDVLRISTTNRITSNKKLEIHLSFKQLDKITLNKGSEILGENNFNLNTLLINSLDGSFFDLDLKTDELKIQMVGKSRGKLKLKQGNAKITLNDNSYLEGRISVDQLDVNQNKSSDIKFDGDCNVLNLNIEGSSAFKSKDLKATTVSINASKYSKSYIYATKDLNIYAKDKSNIYVYGNPEITVKGLNDNAQIVKK